ncbi:MAG: BNR repeat-containing glycosyl hydrolase [Acidobacteria bacterium OLB17]|nr:MAG: BNR repeat-containing glycosyl hydrolase [Acidobacteria bacterium OLB17]MCZ2390036.1 hypothetical protein [Acidobacteriota bacterium]
MKLKILLIFTLILAAAGAAHAEWVKLPTRNFSNLKDIFFQNSETGWITGTDGTLLRTDDGGRTWLPVQKFTTDSILQIYFTDPSTGWMLCERNIYSRGKNPTSYLRKTTDGGVHWDKVEFEDADRERVTRILFDRNGLGLAFGEGGIFYRLQEDGRTWKKSRAAIHFLLLDGAYSSGMNGAIVGAGGTIVFTQDGGLTWEEATILHDTSTRINSVVFTSAKQGWAVGTNGSIFTATGGGRLWRLVPQDETAATLNNVYFTSARDGYIAGNDGTILHTTDAGAHWRVESTRVTHNLNKIVFNGPTGFAIGFGGTILAKGPGFDAPRDARPTLSPKIGE